MGSEDLYYDTHNPNLFCMKKITLFNIFEKESNMKIERHAAGEIMSFFVELSLSFHVRSDGTKRDNLTNEIMRLHYKLGVASAFAPHSDC